MVRIIIVVSWVYFGGWSVIRDGCLVFFLLILIKIEVLGEGNCGEGGVFYDYLCIVLLF